jgi:hypothetical protein
MKLRYNHGNHNSNIRLLAFIFEYIFYNHVKLLFTISGAGQNREIKLGNRSFENVSQFKYLGTTVTNQNLIQKEIKRRLSSGNVC